MIISVRLDVHQLFPIVDRPMPRCGVANTADEPPPAQLPVSVSADRQVNHER